MSAFTIYPLSENAVTIPFGDVINDAIHHKITAFNNKLKQNPFTGFLTTVPAYCTLTVFYDCLQVLGNHTLPGLTCFEKVSGYIQNMLNEGPLTASPLPGSTVSIPVCYDAPYNTGLNEVARYTGLSTAEIIRQHNHATYTVYMIGFIPGFAYLGGMPPTLFTPRKQVPENVPAGAVGIAGGQTGIYPLQTPGGWQIIGRTPLILFDNTRPQPALLKAGDKVIFEQISKQQFNRLNNS